MVCQLPDIHMLLCSTCSADVPVVTEAVVASHGVATPTSATPTSTDTHSVLSQSTLDNILDITCTESWLEDLLGLSPPISLATATPTTVAMATAPLDPTIPSTVSTSKAFSDQELSLPWQPQQLPLPTAQQQVNGDDPMYGCCDCVCL